MARLTGTRTGDFTAPQSRRPARPARQSGRKATRGFQWLLARALPATHETGAAQASGHRARAAPPHGWRPTARIAQQCESGGVFHAVQRRSTRLALVPPKPKLLDSTWVSRASRVVVTRGMEPSNGSGVSTFTEPAMKPLFNMMRQ